MVEGEAVSKGASMARTKAKRTTVDGIEFPSGSEAKRWSELRLMERAGKIADLERQPRQPIFTKGDVTIWYTGDFRYFVDGNPVWEEVKGMQDAAYQLRRKMFVATYPFVALYEIRGRKRLRVYLTQGGLCRTRDEAQTATRRRRK